MKSESTLSLPRTFHWLNLTSFAGAMNDNVFKLLMVYALISWKGEAAAASILASVGLVFALPYLFIAPIAGNFADRFSKHRIIATLKAAEVGIMAFGVCALTLQSQGMLYITMFFMSAQSAFFSPCKYGILPEQVGTDRLSRANGAIQLVTFLAIISGTVLAPELSLLLGGRYHLAASVTLLIALLGLMAALRIEPTPAHPERTLSVNGFGSLLKSIRFIRTDSYLTLSILALAFFSLIAAYTQLNVLSYGFEHLNLSHEQATRLFLLTAIGIGLGSWSAGRLSGRSIEFGIVPVGAAVMCACLFGLGTLASGHWVLAAFNMFFLGVAAGLFVVPLEAFVQYRSPKDRLGSIQAANAFMSWVGILTASALIYVNSNLLEWSAREGFLALSFGLLALSLFSLWVLPDFLLKFVLLVFTRVCYRLRVRGIDNLPVDQPALLVSNHVSLVDALLIASSQQRRIRMLMSRSFYNNANWFTRKVVDQAGVILIHTSDNPKKLVQSLKHAREALDEGYLVCVFAEGALSRTGMMRPFKPGFERIVKGTNYPIIPVYIGGVWGSIASYRDGMPKLRPLRDFRYPVSVHYGAPMPSNSTAFEVQQAVSELSTDAFELNKTERKSLGHECVLSARRNWNKLALADSQGKELKFGEVLTAGLLLRSAIREQTGPDESRVGILLPTGIGSSLVNLALTLDQRTSVNLNYTAPAEVIRSAQTQCDLRTVVTSRQFLERVEGLPLTENVLYIEDLLAGFSRGQKFSAAVKARCWPSDLLAGARHFQPDDVATILFSSGSSAAPKGVMLSHHNLMSNIESFRTVLSPKREDVMLATLPHFHSFGYTASFWFPMVSGLTTACHSNPLEASSIGQLAARYKGSILLTTPSFLLAYSRKIQPEQFAHLRYVFTGAEKLQARVAQIFEKRFGVTPLEGYGATELSPVCALSLPNVEVDSLEETGTREARLGRVLPGMALRIIHPETGERLPAGEEGMICIKGPNVMRGYLHQPELTDSVLKEGWYHTGDLGIMDADGFFAITGRLSRFSKIGGEMISHGAVEKALQDALNCGPDALAVVALPDERKGEKLCVLHTLDLLTDNLSEKLNTLNMPNLWKPHPKDWMQVEALPLLGSGKLDYQRMKQML